VIRENLHKPNGDRSKPEPGRPRLVVPHKSD
jgi:hypothetical protein